MTLAGVKGRWLLFLFVCLFVVFRPTREFFTHSETSPLHVKGCKLFSALMAIEQCEFFSVPHILWHWESVYNGHLRGPVTLTPDAERLAVVLSLPVLTNKTCRGWDSDTQPFACGANALTDCTTVMVHGYWSIWLWLPFSPWLLAQNSFFISFDIDGMNWPLCSPLHPVLCIRSHLQTNLVFALQW